MAVTTVTNRSAYKAALANGNTGDAPDAPNTTDTSNTTSFSLNGKATANFGLQNSGDTTSPQNGVFVVPTGADAGEFKLAAGSYAFTQTMSASDITAFGHNQHLTAAQQRELTYNGQIAAHFQEMNHAQPEFEEEEDDEEDDKKSRIGKLLAADDENTAPVLKKKDTPAASPVFRIGLIGLAARFLHKFKEKFKQDVLRKRISEKTDANAEAEKKLKPGSAEEAAYLEKQRKLSRKEIWNKVNQQRRIEAGAGEVGEALKTGEKLKEATTLAGRAAEAGEAMLKTGEALTRGARLLRTGAEVGVAAVGTLTAGTLAALGGSLVGVAIGTVAIAGVATVAAAAGTYYGYQYFMKRAHESDQKGSALASQKAADVVGPTFYSWTLGIANDAVQFAKSLWNDPNKAMTDAGKAIVQTGTDGAIVVVAVADDRVRGPTLDALAEGIAGHADAFDKAKEAMKAAKENHFIASNITNSSFGSLAAISGNNDNRKPDNDNKVSTPAIADNKPRRGSLKGMTADLGADEPVATRGLPQRRTAALPTAEAVSG